MSVLKIMLGKRGELRDVAPQTRAPLFFSHPALVAATTRRNTSLGFTLRVQNSHQSFAFFVRPTVGVGWVEQLWVFRRPGVGYTVSSFSTARIGLNGVGLFEGQVCSLLKCRSMRHSTHLARNAAAPKATKMQNSVLNGTGLSPCPAQTRARKPRYPGRTPGQGTRSPIL